MSHIIVVQILYRFGFARFSVAVGKETDRQIVVAPVMRKTLAALCISVAVGCATWAADGVITRHSFLLTCYSYSRDTALL